MKEKNQLVVLSGVLVLLVTATIAATFNVQPANAVQPTNTPNAYGKEQIAGTAQTGKLGTYVSACNHGSDCGVGIASTHPGIAEFRANGDKYPDGYANGQGGPNFR